MDPFPFAKFFNAVIDRTLIYSTTTESLDALSVAEEAGEQGIGEHDIARTEGPADCVGIEEGGWWQSAPNGGFVENGNVVGICEKATTGG